MESSNELIDAIKQFEGLSLVAYKCPAGILTIGYGHTGKMINGNLIKIGDTITELLASSLLEKDIDDRVKLVNNLNLLLTQDLFDAIVDFIFNLGYSKFINSTLYKLIKNNSNKEVIANEFKRWVYGGGKILPGLVKRRNWEYNKYIK